MKIGIIGSGNVGGTLGAGWARAGHEITFGTRDPADQKVRQTVAAAGANARAAGVAAAVAGAEVVVLAVPWGAVNEALTAAGDLSGKVLIDCVNPLGAGLELAHGHTTSGSEVIAGQAAGARVVKCFNSVGYNIMAQPAFGGQRALMCLAGDDPVARALASGLAAELGFEPVDCGPLRNARLIEPFAALWIWLAMNGMGREFAFGLLRR